MYIDELGRITFSSNDLIREIYKGNLEKLDYAHVSVNDADYLKYIQFLTDNGLRDWPIPLPENTTEIDKDQFDTSNQNTWLMPLEYKEYPVEEYLLGLCKTTEEVDRVKLELDLFKENNMLELLCFLIFLVDKLRENTILWGVGRGSSVASYILYLIGIHKIDSIKYKLPIEEFLRGESNV